MTVRVGAIGVFLLSVADAMNHITWLRAMPMGEMNFWAAALRTAVSVAVGVFFAWGIARLNGIIYGCWFALTLLMIAVDLGLSVWRFVSSLISGRSTSFEGGLVAMGLLWLFTSAFLLAPSSVRAFWRHGRIASRSRVG
jgi:hypothetical protein